MTHATMPLVAAKRQQARIQIRTILTWHARLIRLLVSTWVEFRNGIVLEACSGNNRVERPWPIACWVATWSPCDDVEKDLVDGVSSTWSGT